MSPAAFPQNLVLTKIGTYRGIYPVQITTIISKKENLLRKVGKTTYLFYFKVVSSLICHMVADSVDQRSDCVFCAV